VNQTREVHFRIIPYPNAPRPEVRSLDVLKNSPHPNAGSTVVGTVENGAI